MAPSISIIHPSRSRPEQAKATHARWMSRVYNPDTIEYHLMIDSDDPLRDEYHSPPNGYFHEKCNKSAIGAINKTLPYANGNLIIIISDDFDCPINWDIQLLEALDGEEDFVVKTQDLQQPWLITLPIMDRTYADRFGYVYHPYYLHMFSDTEMTHVAHMLGRVIELPITFPHNHYTTGKTKKDAVNEKNDATWDQGESLYLERLKRNFDLDLKDIVNPASHCHHTHKDWLKQKGIVL